MNFNGSAPDSAAINRARLDQPFGLADFAFVVVGGVKELEVQTEKKWAFANEFMFPRVMVITKLDKEHADFATALKSAQNTLVEQSFRSLYQSEKKKISVASSMWSI